MANLDNEIEECREHVTHKFFNIFLSYPKIKPHEDFIFIALSI